MADEVEQAHFDAVFLTKHGLFSDYRKAMAAPDTEREMLVRVLKLVLDMERAEMVAMIVKAMGG